MFSWKELVVYLQVYKLMENFPSIMQLFMSIFKNTLQTAKHASKILGGILSFWYDLDVSTLDMAVCTSSSEMGRKEKLLFSKANLFMLMTLGWFLYIFIALSIES